jgi:two-component system phosphate regulon sensor histidine kinase PhoR
MTVVSIKLVALILLSLLVVWLAWSRYRMRQRIRQLYREIDSLKMRGAEFVANVSHELKTPLTSIKGFAETLKSGAVQDPQRAIEFLSRIENNAERLSLLINDILDLSKIESPNVHLDHECFNPAEELDDLIKDFGVKLHSRGQQLSISNKVDSLVADRRLFDQVIRNLVENAHRYCGDGARIDISSERVIEQGETYNRFTVSDNGPGISAEDLPRIFERFYRTDKSRNRLLGGTGLGLAIVKHIMMSHGGFVRVASEPFKGSSFSIYFPLEKRPPILS